MDLPAVWSMFFASVASINEHPGSGRGDSRKKSLEECAAIADVMLRLYMERFSCQQHGQQ